MPGWVDAAGQPATVTRPPVTAAAARKTAALDRSGSTAQSRARIAPGADLPREAGEQGFEEGLAQPGREIPDCFAAGGLDEGGDVQPLVAVVAERDGPLADGRPDAAADRLQAEAVLVRRPDLDRAVGMRRPGLGDSGLEPP